MSRLLALLRCASGAPGRSAARQSEIAGSDFVIDLDQRRGIFRDSARLRDHDRDGLADKNDFVLGKNDRA